MFLTQVNIFFLNVGDPPNDEKSHSLLHKSQTTGHSAVE